MQISLKANESYSRVITRYSLLTLLSVFGCSLLGYIFLPFAAASYAAILIYENPSKRILSYVIPVIAFALNFLLRGLYSIEGAAYIAIALVIYCCVKRNKSKGETAFWISFAILACIVISILLLLVELSLNAGYDSIVRFFRDYYRKYKEFFLENVTSLVYEGDNGELSFVFNLYEAEMLFRELIIYAVPLAFLVSFVLSGLTLKLFVHSVEKNSDEQCEIYGWNFAASNLVSYFYIALALVSLVATADGSTFSFVIFTLNTIFTAVFAYIGIKAIYYVIISKGKSKAFAIVLLVLAILLLSSFAFQILSYFGVIMNILTNKVISKKGSGK